MDPLFRWILAGVLLIGSPFAAIGGWEAMNTSRELRRAVRAWGTVVENRLVTDHHDGLEERAYVPIVQFVDTTGRARRFTDPAGSLPPDYAVGERVEIAFNPENPGQARVTSWKRLWLVPTLLISVGLLPAAIAAAIFRCISRSSATRAIN
jgi:hypothetical protein